MEIKKQLIELKKEIFKLESDLKSLDYQEHRAIEDYYESIKGRGVTEGGARPHINGIHREFEGKRIEISERLNQANLKFNTLELEAGLHWRPEKMSFDSLNGVIRCRDIKPYSFHRGGKGDAPRLLLFRKLWDERKFIVNGIVKKGGKAFPVSALASQLEISEDKIHELAKGLNRVLKNRKFPAEIEKKNGLLLIVAE